MTARADRKGADAPAYLRGVWWLTPGGTLLLVAVPTLLLAARTSDLEFRTAWGTPKLLTSHAVWLAAAGAAVFALAAALPVMPYRPTARPWPALTSEQVSFLQRAARVLFWLTMVGYAAFTVTAYRNGLRLTGIVSDLKNHSLYGVNADITRVTGVTSLTQVGPAFVVVATLVLVHRRDDTIRRHLAVLGFLAVTRALLSSERLAVLELVLPAVTVLAFRAVAVGDRRARLRTRLAPAVFIPAVFVVFGAFEYFRSWSYYSTRTTVSFPQFALERLGGYYATAYNNGQIELTYQQHAGRVPYDTIRALWTVPGSALYGGYPGNGVDPATQYADLLTLHGNPEYNSPCGLILPFVDWGTIGGFVFLGIFGMILGVLYRRCRDGAPFAVLLFPAATTGLFELTRYFPWTQGRYTPAFVALTVVCFLMRRQSAVAEPAERQPAEALDG